MDPGRAPERRGVVGPVPGPEITPLAAFGAELIDAPPHPDWIVADGDRVWVAGVEPGVAVFRAGTGARVGSVAIEGELCGAPDTGFGSVWFPACSPSAIHRVSVATGKVTARIPLALPAEGEFTIGAGEGGVWAVLEPSGGSGRLARIDPASDRVVEVFEVPLGAWSVRAAHGWLWIACPSEDRVIRVDPADGAVTADIPTGRGPRFLVAGEDGVWVLNQTSGSVTHIDASGRVAASVEVDGGPMKGGDLAVGLGSVWVRGTTELVARIDPVRHEVVERIGEPTIGSASVAAVDGEVWASAGRGGVAVQDPRRGGERGAVAERGPAERLVPGHHQQLGAVPGGERRRQVHRVVAAERVAIGEIAGEMDDRVGDLDQTQLIPPFLEEEPRRAVGVRRRAATPMQR